MGHSAAAELVSISLRKILSKEKRESAFVEEVKAFLANIHQIIPDQQSQQQPAAAAAAAAAAAEAAAQGPEQAVHEEGKTEGESSGEKAGVDAPTDAAEAVPSTPPKAAQNHGQDSGKESEEGGVGADRGGPPAAETSSAQQDAQGHTQGTQATGPIPPAYSLAPRTATALPDAACSKVLGIMQKSVDTGKAAIIEIALDCIQKLVAFSFLQGAVYAIDCGSSKDVLDAGEHAPLSFLLPLCAHLVSAVQYIVCKRRAHGLCLTNQTNQSSQLQWPFHALLTEAAWTAVPVQGYARTCQEHRTHTCMSLHAHTCSSHVCVAVYLAHTQLQNTQSLQAART
jgi:hypothetical protein